MSYQQRTASSTRTATPGQISTLKRMLTEHQLYDGVYDRLWKLLEVHETDVERPGDGTRMSLRTASATISWLGRSIRARQVREFHPDADLGGGPRRVVRANRAAASRSPAPMGVHRKGGRIYIVREFTPDGETEKVRYAKEVVPLTSGQGDRQTEDGQPARWREIPARGMQWHLTEADLISREELTKLSLRSGSCFACHHKLYLDVSIDRAIGPVCAGRQPKLADKQSDAAVQLAEVLPAA
jgi:Family of unknown function (DUF6011)